MKPTTDEVLAWAREADLPACHTTHPKALIRFAALAYAAGAAEMKERCAKVCEAEESRILSRQSGRDYDPVDTNLRMIACVIPDIAKTIRALGDDAE